jgi:malate synthase
MTTATRGMVDGVELRAPVPEEGKLILTPEALKLIAKLHRSFDGRRRALLEERVRVQSELDKGWLPDFSPETAAIRQRDWVVGATPADLMDRRVEITGPVDRKTVINALNSGASVFMADFEDANTPSWTNNVVGQLNLRDAVRGCIEYVSPEGKQYSLNKKTAVLMVRPRGWHLPEKHLLVDGEPVSGALFDFALYFYHNAHALVEKGAGPYFYLPKLESHHEARLWNDVFVMAQRELALPSGTIKVTVLIETILAAFQMHEILWELRDHIVGLNCGRWDYIFSFIKKFRSRPEFVLPDRAQVTMTTHFMRSYSLLAIQTCHRRGAHAMGGMAAQIPIRTDPVANETALRKVREDKEREASDGHDGTWVAHPGLVPVALEVFNASMPEANQRNRLREDVHVGAADLLEVPSGTITEAGLRINVNVGIRYLESWLRGTGCVPIFNLMEDAATCEISRTQIWQWLKHPRGVLEDGRRISVAVVQAIVDEELQKIRADLGADTFDQGKFLDARTVFEAVATREPLADFLTLPAYDLLA